MRLDLFLKYSRLVPRRPVAQEMCDAGAVTLNGHQAKSGKSVSVGDSVSIKYRGRQTTVRVLIVPARPPSKADAAGLYEVTSVTTYE